MMPYHVVGVSLRWKANILLSMSDERSKLKAVTRFLVKALESFKSLV